MNKPTARGAWLLLCAMIFLNACQKETSTSHETGPVSEPAYRLSGVIPDDKALLAKIPILVSSEFYSLPTARNKPKGGGGTTPSPATTDSDGDGIADSVDACPTQAETFNGYQDTDGCPDAAPTTTLPPPASPLPVSFSLQMPPVQQQGGEGCCVAFAAGYAARSAEQFYRTNAGSYSAAANIFSPEFLFNQTKSGTSCSGSALLTALDFLVNKGICTWQSMPYSYSNGCSLLPTSTQTAEAANFRIASYKMIYASDKAAIKTIVSSKHPVIVSCMIDNNFYNAQPGFIWKSFGSSYTMHAFVICGYDDSKNAYKVMNSWGTSWGEGGYSWVDYDFLSSVCYEVFALNV